MKLIHNTPIKIRKDYRFRRKHLDVQDIRWMKKRMVRTDKPERTYYIWFLSLKLLLEMEKLGLGFQKFKKKLVIGKDVKIDKEFYKEWDLDDVLIQPFYKWWKTHQRLFENPLTVEVDDLKVWSPKPHFRFLRVDTRNNYTTIMKDIRNELEDLKGKKSKKISKYRVYGEPQYDNEILKYNLMVRFLNDEEDLDMFTEERGRLKKVEKGYKERDENEVEDNRVMESKIWNLEKIWKKLSPKDKEKQYIKIRREDVWDREEGKYYYKREKKTMGRDIDKQFRSTVRTEINRYVKDYQRILNGVSQGKYRKSIKF